MGRQLPTAAPAVVNPLRSDLSAGNHRITSLAGGVIDRYVNPNTGSDSNNGTQAAPWASFAPVNTWLATAVPGARVLIDTSGGPLYTWTNVLVLHHLSPGTEVCSATHAPAHIIGGRKIGAGEWTKTGGLTNVYQCPVVAGGGTQTGGVTPFENDLYPHLIVGASFGAVSASLDSTAGSYWTDDSTLYYHPFGNTDPRVDGKTYVLSSTFTPVCIGDGGDKAANVCTGSEVANVRIHDLIISHCIGTNQTTGLVGRTTYGIAGGCAGYSEIFSIDVYNYGNHGVATISDAPNAHVVYRDISVRLANPYYFTTPFVDYGDNTLGMTGIIHEYIRCSCSLHNEFDLASQQIAATLTAGGNGIDNTGGSGNLALSQATIFGSHFNGSNPPFQKLIHRDCYAPYGGVSVPSGGVAEGIYTYGGEYDQLPSCHQLTAFGTTFHAPMVAPDSSTANLVFNQCKFNLNYGFMRPGMTLAGTISIIGCEFDYTNSQGEFNSSGSRLFDRSASLVSFTFLNNRVTMNPTYDTSIFGTFNTTDTVYINGNEYRLGTGYMVSTTINGVTRTVDLSQWRQMGYDAPSILPSQQERLLALTTTANLTGFWRFEEATGSNAKDLSGLRNDGTYNNVTLAQVGINGFAASFNGTSSYVDTPSQALTVVNRFHLRAWAQKNTSGSQTIMCQAEGTGTSFTFYFRVGANSGFRDNTSGNYREVTVPDCSLKVWHLHELDWDGTFLRYYLDGVLNATSSNFAGSSPFNLSNHCIIGRLGDVASTYWNGLLDEVQVLNASQSAEQCLTYFYASGGNGYVPTAAGSWLVM